jgi:hypothetical protein
MVGMATAGWADKRLSRFMEHFRGLAPPGEVWTAAEARVVWLEEYRHGRIADEPLVSGTIRNKLRDRPEAFGITVVSMATPYKFRFVGETPEPAPVVNGLGPPGHIESLLTRLLAETILVRKALERVSPPGVGRMP